METEKMPDNIEIFYFGYSPQKTIIKKTLNGISIPAKEERVNVNVLLNPNDDDLFRTLLSKDSSVEKRTIAFDYRLITKKMVEQLEWAYSSKLISGIRIIPSHAVLSKEKFDLLNIKGLTGFIVAVNSLSKDIKTKVKYIDIREQHGICTIEHIEYKITDFEYKKNDNIHINKRLSKIETKSLAKIIKKGSYRNIIVNYYNPAYYKEFLDYLSMERIPKNITIIFLGNPLYDELSCFECFHGIIKNNVLIKYNTSCELNHRYLEEPYSEGIRYYSDIEVSGLTKSTYYYELLKLQENIIEYMHNYKFTPLEKIVFVRDYLKSNYDYDPTYQEKRHTDTAHLDYDYMQDKIFQEGLANIVSVILRRENIPCYVYSSTNIKKNIIRVTDSKYQVDNIAIMDIHEEMKNDKYAKFLLPIDDELYGHKENALGSDIVQPEVLNLPISLSIATDDYNKYINISHPPRINDIIKEALIVLKKMGLIANKKLTNREEEIEFYKSAFHNARLKRKLSYDSLSLAIHNVREKTHKYSDEYESYMDYEKIISIINKRGNTHIFDPTIKTNENEVVPVNIYVPSLDVDFTESEIKTMIINHPRCRNENETLEDFTCYLTSYYDTILNVKYKERIKMENVEEFRFVDEDDDSSKYEIITIYMDQDDMGRTFVTEPVIKRFHLERPMLKLTLDTDEEIYEIEQESVNYIIDNQNNNYAPYSVIYQLFNFKNELQDELEGTNDNTYGLDELTIYRDIDNQDRVFVSLGIVERFHLDTYGDVVRLGEDTLIYEISVIDAINIAANRNNNYAPYRVNYVDIEFTPAIAEPIMPYNDELSQFDKEEEEVMPYDDDLSLFDKKDTSPSIVEPRPRRIDESVRDYKIYLEGYYDGAYANMRDDTQNSVSKEEDSYIPGTKFKTPRKKGTKESQEEYEEYLKVFYGRIFGAVENINKLGSSIIKRRPQREDESDDEYNRWLAEQTGIPVVDAPLYVE